MPQVLFIVHDYHQEDNQFPLNIGYLSSVLRQAKIDVRIYSQDIYHYNLSHLSNFLKHNKFDAIGISFLSPRFKTTILPLCKTINKFKKNAWLILGGHGPSPIPEYVLNETQADIVATGEAENVVIDIINSKTSKYDLANVDGIAYRINDEIYINKRNLPINDLDSIPFPAWDLFPIERYSTSSLLEQQSKSDKSLSILSSRGCTGNCNFCFHIHHKIRFRSIENVIEEIKLLKKRYGINYFFFADELFVSSEDRLYEFRDGFDKEKLKINFYCNSRVDLIDDELIKCLKSIGCKSLGLGFESMNQKVLNRMNKDTTIEQNNNAAKVCKENELPIKVNMIWGNIFDTKESLIDDVKFIKKYTDHSYPRTINPVIPFPGTSLYYYAIRKGFLKDADDFFNKFKNSDLFTVNFTDIGDEDYYKFLFNANKEIILDYVKHTSNDNSMAKQMIDSFYDLYFKKDYSFRGLRNRTRLDKKSN